MLHLQYVYIFMAAGYLLHGIVALANEHYKNKSQTHFWRYTEHTSTILLSGACAYAAFGYTFH